MIKLWHGCKKYGIVCDGGSCMANQRLFLSAKFLTFRPALTNWSFWNAFYKMWYEFLFLKFTWRCNKRWISTSPLCNYHNTKKVTKTESVWIKYSELVRRFQITLFLFKHLYHSKWVYDKFARYPILHQE